VIRTSVDHGTAFDLAGTGAADERSMIEALRQAAELAQARESSANSSPAAFLANHHSSNHA
jgi:4-hydroxythreonine-4-phosphate dehydrogenase